MPVFLTAPKDLQRTPAYNELLRVLSHQRHREEEVVADRDLFRDNRHWKKSWKKVEPAGDLLGRPVRFELRCHQVSQAIIGREQAPFGTASKL